MGRGLGGRQRELLAALAALDGDGPPQFHPFADLTAGLSRTQFESARQAVHGLQARRLVRLTRRVVGTRAQVFVRITESGKEVITRDADRTTDPK